MKPTLLLLLSLMGARPGLAQDRPGRAAPEEIARPMGLPEGNLAPGDVAPDFELKRRGSDERVRLSTFRGRKPVLIYFGSFT